LATQNAVQRYQTIGGVFKGTKQDIIQTRLHQRLIGLMIAILEAIDDLFETIDIEEVFTKIINDKTAFNKILAILNISDNSQYKQAA